MIKKYIKVGASIPVIRAGTKEVAKVRRIGEFQNAGSGFRMMTLDIGGEVAYAVCREEELADG